MNHVVASLAALLASLLVPKMVLAKVEPLACSSFRGSCAGPLLDNSQFFTTPPRTTTKTIPPNHRRHIPSTMVKKHHQQHFCSPSPPVSFTTQAGPCTTHRQGLRPDTGDRAPPARDGAEPRGPATQGALNDGPCHLQRDTPWPPTHLDRRGEDVPESPRQQMARAPSHTTGPLAHTPDGGKQRPTNPRRRVFSLNLGRSTRNFDLAPSTPNSPRLPR
jgi:hypothetical protein